MATYHDKPDDEALSVFSFADIEAELPEEEGEVTEELYEEAVAAQRLAVSRLTHDYVEGRMAIATVTSERRITPEKVFNVPRLLEWTGGDPDVVVDACRAGRVRARLNATMGTGKSTKLAPYLANALGYRVLMVGLNAHAMQAAGVYMASVGLGGYKRRWSLTPGARVCCMTYGDFNGHMRSARRVDVFKSFDLFIFDEAFVGSHEVYEAKRAFAAYAVQDANLLLCSATMRTDVAFDSVESKGMGTFKEVATDYSVADVVASGKLVDTYLTDRTMVLVATDDDVSLLLEHYSDYGVDVKTLDSAASYEDEVEVSDWLQGDSMSPRVLVAHSQYHIAFNFPVEFLVLFPEYSKVVEVDGVWKVQRFPMTPAMVAQAKARSGRGIADASGGLVVGERRGEESELYVEERLRAFVGLLSMYIKPIPAAWEDCYAVFPNGLSPQVALTILKSTLPVKVAAMYLGPDGRVARKYSRAYNVFSQPDHFALPSDSDLPLGFERWVTQPYSSSESGEGAVATVPVQAEGELRTVLFSMSLMAEGKFEIPRWRARVFEFWGDGDSGDEGEGSRYGRRVARLRKVVDRPAPAVPEPPTIGRALEWAYHDSTEVGAMDVRRRAVQLDKTRFREALKAMEDSLLEYTDVRPSPVEVVATDSGPVGRLDLPGRVESPGGTLVCEMPAVVCERLNLGKLLNPTDFMSVVSAYRVNPHGFVASRLFDAYSGPWESILRSIVNEDVMSHFVRKGAQFDVFSMVDSLRGRFSTELVHTLKCSNIFKRKFARLFKYTPSADKLMAELRAGRFYGVAQTDGFIKRVIDIKSWIDDALLQAETRAVYLPNHITRAQRMLPIHGSSSLGVVGRNLAAVPRSVNGVPVLITPDGAIDRERFKGRFERKQVNF